MKLYIDKENVISLMKHKGEEHFYPVVDMFRTQLEVKYNFYINDLSKNYKSLDDEKLDEAEIEEIEDNLDYLRAWFHLLNSDGFESNEPRGFDKDGCTYCPDRSTLQNYKKSFRKKKDFSSIYLLNESVLCNQIKPNRDILIGKVGDEMDILFSLYISEDEQFAKDISWQEHLPTLPFSEIIISDPYFLSNFNKGNQLLIEALKNAHKDCSFNLVIFSKKHYYNVNLSDAEINDIKEEIESMSDIHNVFVAIVTCDNLTHDRCLISNYYRIKHGQGFNVISPKADVTIDIKSNLSKHSNSITNALLDVLKRHVQKGKRDIFGNLYSILLSTNIE